MSETAVAKAFKKYGTTPSYRTASSLAHTKEAELVNQAVWSFFSAGYAAGLDAARKQRGEKT